MFKATLSAILILTVQAVLAQDHGVGAPCDNVVGSTCKDGLICCQTSPQPGVCYDGDQCPDKFLMKGDHCSGLTGSRGTCFPGLKCCPIEFVSDNSICAEKCPA